MFRSALRHPKTFEFWVFHQGMPEMRPMELHECLRTPFLPPVPLDGLSPESPKSPRPTGRKQGRAGAYTPGRDSSTSVAYSGSTPYTLKDREEMFPHLSQQQRKYHQPHPPLTPGLPTTFKSGFFRERVRESSEERRIRLGQAKATQPAPGIAEAVAEMRALTKKLLGPSLGGPGDPLLWDASARDFSAGLARPAKTQPTSFHASRRTPQPSSPY